MYQEIGRRGPGTVYRGSNLSEIQCARVWLVALQKGYRVLVKPEREEGDRCWGPAPHKWCLADCRRCARRRGPGLIHPREREHRAAVRAVVSISPGPEQSVRERAEQESEGERSDRAFEVLVTPDSIVGLRSPEGESSGEEPEAQSESGESSSLPSSESSAEVWEPGEK